MNLHLEYITDAKGRHKAVVIPAKEWDEYQAENERLKNKLGVLLGIQNAMKEVKEIQKGKKKGKTLLEFLDEN